MVQKQDVYVLEYNRIMAVFEKKKLDKVTLDDSIPLKCVIDSAEKREDHMVNVNKRHVTSSELEP